MSGETVTITQDETVDAGTAGRFNGKTLAFAGAFTLTLHVGLPPGFGFAARPPASGDATIAVADDQVTLNGAGDAVTRSVAANTLFAVADLGGGDYAVTGV